MLQNLPQDPVILLSVINTKLRDFYPSLDQLCSEMEVNKEELTDKLDLTMLMMHPAISLYKGNNDERYN